MDYLQASLTALIAVGVFVVGQFILRVVLEPIQELRLQIGRTNALLIVWADIYYEHAVDAERRIAAYDELRAAAGELVAKAQAVLWYPPRWMRLVPSWGDVYGAHKSLIGISNSMITMNAGQVNDWRRDIANRLRLRAVR